MRRRFCGGVSWPEDRSSFDLYATALDSVDLLLTCVSYFFGGLAPYGEEGYGYADAWVLSLPSFTWTIVSWHEPLVFGITLMCSSSTTPLRTHIIRSVAMSSTKAR